MTNSDLPGLAALSHKDYIAEIKKRLRNDDTWQVMLDPVLTGRTRSGLHQIIDSIDRQVQQAVDPEQGWLIRIGVLRKYVKARLDGMPTLADTATREGKAWRAFSARLATALRDNDSTVLDTLQTPYGALSAREWLVAREAKR